MDENEAEIGSKRRKAEGTEGGRRAKTEMSKGKASLYDHAGREGKERKGKKVGTKTAEESLL